MHNLDFIQNFRAQGQILAKRIVKHGTEDRTATTAVDGGEPVAVTARPLANSILAPGTSGGNR